MKALKFHQTGSLEYLKLEEVNDPIPRPGEVIVQLKAAAINPSDVKNVLGKITSTTFPRIPGRDFAGLVVSDSKWKGKSVFGTGGTLGSLVDGTHAEFVSVPESALVELPKNLSFTEAAAMGLSYLTAWQAIMIAGQFKGDETILITGATGAVGNAAVHIAHSLGANVIGTVKSTTPPKELFNKAHWIDLNQDKLLDAVMKLTKEQGVNLTLDVVGGPLFEPCLKCLSNHGRQVNISSVEPIVSFNLIDFYHKQAHLIGVDTFKLSFTECADILRCLLPGIEKGLFIPQAIEQVSLAHSIQAYQQINVGAAQQKHVIVFEK